MVWSRISDEVHYDESPIIYEKDRQHPSKIYTYDYELNNIFNFLMALGKIDLSFIIYNIIFVRVYLVNEIVAAKKNAKKLSVFEDYKNTRRMTQSVLLISAVILIKDVRIVL